MKFPQPIFSEELEKKNFYQDILFNSKKNFPEKILENFLKDFSKKTKFLEISEIFRYNLIKNYRKKQEQQINYPKNLEKKENSIYFLFYTEILFLKESSLLTSNKEGIFFYFFYVDYAILKKFFFLCRYLIKKIEEGGGEKTKFFLKLNLYKIDYFFIQKNYKASKNCLNFLQNLTEKEETDKKAQIEIFLKAGILSVKENKIVLAFSFFFEALEKISNFNKLESNLIFELLLFCSNFIKKKKINIIYKKNQYKHNISNFVFLEYLITGLGNENFVLLETSIRKKFWPEKFLTIRFFLSKYFNFIVQKNLKQCLETFIRIPLTELSIITGISGKKIYLMISKMILNGKTKGLLDFQTNSFVGFKKVNNFSFLSDLLNIFIQLDQIV